MEIVIIIIIINIIINIHTKFTKEHEDFWCFTSQSCFFQPNGKCAETHI